MYVVVLVCSRQRATVRTRPQASARQINGGSYRSSPGLNKAAARVAGVAGVAGAGAGASWAWPCIRSLLPYTTTIVAVRHSPSSQLTPTRPLAPTRHRPDPRPRRALARPASPILCAIVSPQASPVHAPPACLSRPLSVIHGPRNTSDHHFPIRKAQRSQSSASQLNPYPPYPPLLTTCLLPLNHTDPLCFPGSTTPQAAALPRT
ncbi:hypothetical protein COCMIDRAFT_101894 [Bipolaris oryzae ATCC 44560]|uniref:Uncharacterized protein n=1 Tax=Bipolaris oryzae ATCC 44560 TaxID=930090 RepID=W6ZHM9_COCMI|nr:uncharacterized protein COCMIDRAFT_101894 [Bipolaris oryzae ATCC 44560]EUC43066.1 hypothetical protein COCMIDRAFT_101894 [Bipolaris oryzae ATCC 44560]